MPTANFNLRHNLLLFEAFLYENITQSQYCFTILPKQGFFLSLSKDNVSATEHKLQYNAGVTMQDNVAQHYWNSTILMGNTVSNTGKFVNMVYPDFFVEDGGRNIHHSESGNR